MSPVHCYQVLWHFFLPTLLLCKSRSSPIPRQVTSSMVAPLEHKSLIGINLCGSRGTAQSKLRSPSVWMGLPFWQSGCCCLNWHAESKLWGPGFSGVLLEKESGVFVAASSRCFPDLSFDAALLQLVDLEYTNVEIAIHESGGHMKPSEVLADLDRAIQTCRRTHRLDICAFSVDIESPEPAYYNEFAACCKLAKAVKVVTLVVRSAELGTPFNAEVERLRAMAAIATLEGVRVGLLTEAGRMTQDPDTAVVLCKSVKGLGIALDPSHFICGPHGGDCYEQVMEHVYHVRLRDTSKTQLQVRVGQGEVEYGKLVNQLNKYRYDRALCVDIFPRPGLIRWPNAGICDCCWRAFSKLVFLATPFCPWFTVCVLPSRVRGRGGAASALSRLRSGVSILLANSICAGKRKLEAYAT